MASGQDRRRAGVLRLVSFGLSFRTPDRAAAPSHARPSAELHVFGPIRPVQRCVSAERPAARAAGGTSSPPLDQPVTLSAHAQCSPPLPFPGFDFPTRRTIYISLSLAANDDERAALADFAQKLDDAELVLPGDPRRRQLRLRVPKRAGPTL